MHHNAFHPFLLTRRALLGALLVGGFVAASSAAPDDCAHGDAHMQHFENMDDPHEFIRNAGDIDSYTAVGWWLMRSQRTEDALDLVGEAIAANPEAFQLYCVKGQLHFRHARHEAAGTDPFSAGPKAKEALEEARKAYTRAAELGLVERLRTKNLTWTLYKEKDVRYAVRMAFFLEKRLGNPLAARVLGEEYVRQLGGDFILERNLR